MDPRKKAGGKPESGTPEKIEGAAGVIYFGDYIVAGLTYLMGPSSPLNFLSVMIPAFYYFLYGFSSIYKTLRGTYLQRVAHAIASALDVAAFVGLAGLTLNPATGWAFAAAATLVGWVGDSLIPTWYAYQADKACDKQMSVVEKELASAQKNNEVERIAELQGRLQGLQQQKSVIHQDYLDKRNKAIWGFAAVVGMALFACGPFGLTALGIAGSAIFVGLAVKGIVSAITNWWQGRNEKTTAATAKTDINPDESALTSKAKKENTKELAKTSHLSTNIVSETLTPRESPVNRHKVEQPKESTRFVSTDTSLVDAGKFSRSEDARRTREQVVDKPLPVEPPTPKK